MRSIAARVAPSWVHSAYWRWNTLRSRWPKELQPYIQSTLERVSGSTAIVTEYPARPRARWGWGFPPHPELALLLAESAGSYRQLVGRFEALLPTLRRIPSAHEDSGCGFWDNPYFENLDGVALYVLVAERRPATFVEIGSGFSTRMARRAITDAGLKTRLVSIDPHPRVDVEGLCDEVHRVPMQDAPLGLFDALQGNDIVLVDGTHVVHMSSDATIVFTEVLPRLTDGVLVGMDDIFLPWDYPPEWIDRWYSEQYLLAVSLLSGDPTWRAVFASWWASHEASFAPALATLEKGLRLTKPIVGKSWWMERTVKGRHALAAG
jgi:hypothetical protein